MNVTAADGAVALEHAHPDELNVYDFVGEHPPGNDDEYDGGRRNPMRRSPSARPRGRAHVPELAPDLALDDDTSGSRRSPAGRRCHHDAVAATTAEAAAAFGARLAARDAHGDGFEACGWPGEVGDEPALGARFTRYVATKSDPHSQDVLADHPFGNTHSKQMVWFGAALGAPDQLRQRVAWAIAQILVVGEHLTGRENEVWHNFYDIFVRHAFGNYRDVLREISYSPLMADYLTFLGNKALSYQKEVLGTEAFPDENFAREIMQLFTIGLFALRPDGTRELDASGTPVAAYGNDEIMTFARAWTGFERNDARANVEGYGPETWGAFNWIDPMKIEAQWRDPFPKRDLLGGHVGDGFARCSDLPPRAFLRKGAKWRYLGFDSPLPALQDDPTWDGYDSLDTAEVTRLDLDPFNSSLYAALCSPGATEPLGGSAAETRAPCSWQSTVTLGTHLPCHGTECSVDTARVVRLAIIGAPANATAWFEYVRAPCVEMTFFPNAKIIRERFASGDQMCADPREAVATAACCATSSSSDANPLCDYRGERVSFATAEARCTRRGATTGVAIETWPQRPRRRYVFLDEFAVLTARAGQRRRVR